MRTIYLAMIVSVMTAIAHAQSTPTDRITRGGASVLIEPDGIIRLQPRVGASVRLTASCANALPSLPGEARFCYDAVSNAMRISLNGGPYVLWTNPAAGPGTVTSVGLTVAPSSLFTVTGSPITTAGTFTVTMANAGAHQFLGGPLSGGPAAPVFRTLDPSDIPSLDTSKITSGILPIARGGTGLSSYTFGDLLYANGTGQLTRLPGNTTTQRQFLSMTGDGTFAGAPTWRALDLSDIPPIQLSANGNGGATGILPVAKGGTGLNTIGPPNTLLGVASGGSSYEFKQLVAGNNISLSQVGNQITIAATGTLSANFRAADGTAAVPGFAFDAQPATGVFRDTTTGDVGVATNGIERGRFTANGLQVAGDIQLNGQSLDARYDARYVNVSGDTMTGTLTVPAVRYSDNTIATSVVQPEYVIGEFFNEHNPISIGIPLQQSIVLTRAGSPVYRSASGGYTQSSYEPAYQLYVDAGRWANIPLSFEVDYSINNISGGFVELWDDTAGVMLTRVFRSWGGTYNQRAARSQVFTLSGTGVRRLIVRLSTVGLVGSTATGYNLYRARLIANPAVTNCGSGNAAYNNDIYGCQ